MNGRYFDGRLVECDYYDGKTDFNVLFLSYNSQIVYLENCGF